ncbi:type I restriction-modification system subunit M [Variovorax boronicumulans]|uniref:type I restriction-modification system subunit M n=1 Tax=Variovorax boronicumulans TaxID=436515 RepID=UPI002789290C|nr:class I SAM-dependent DNA methyltransferase [Variovorax boronicumulans]MDQ0045403.1 type I restriction enzyme M protein [Variovorax boronicumulans]
MLDRQALDAIGAAIWRVCDVLRGTYDLGESKNLVVAVLLLKYVSDAAQYRPSSPGELGARIHYTVPEGASFNELLAVRHDGHSGLRINNALRAIEASNIVLQGIFQGIDFDATRLGSAEQRERLLRALLEAFTAPALSFGGPPNNAAAAAAAACDALIGYVAASGGRWAAESFTPPEISRLIARLLQPMKGDAVGDPCCGSGSMLVACSQAAREASGGQGCLLYGQEVNGSTWALAKMNMILHSEDRHQLEWGDTLRNPRLLAADGSLRKFDIVVSSPPFSLRDWGHEAADQDVHRRYWRGVPPRAAGDYAFISHMVETLKPGVGRMAVVVSHGVLFRGGAERAIREQLIKENLIDAVIALPVKMFAHTGIPVAILVLRKHKTDHDVLFIDASRSFQPGKIQNALRQTDLELIEKTSRARHHVHRYAQLVPQVEIAASDYNLAVARYVDATEDEAGIDPVALRAERDILKTEMAGLEAKLTALLRELGHG